MIPGVAGSNPVVNRCLRVQRGQLTFICGSQREYYCFAKALRVSLASDAFFLRGFCLLIKTCKVAGPASSRANNSSKTPDVTANRTSVADLFNRSSLRIEGLGGGSGGQSATIFAKEQETIHQRISSSPF